MKNELILFIKNLMEDNNNNNKLCFYVSEDLRNTILNKIKEKKEESEKLIHKI
jgi:hypothetical protein